MAKKSMIARDKKRAILVTKYSVQRVELRARVKDIALSEVERMEAQIALPLK